MRNKKTVTLSGIVISGTGEAGKITEIPWVKQQFIEKIGINPHPGTFNIMVLPEDITKLEELRNAKGVTIISRDTEHCSGISLPVRVEGKINGAIVIPLIPNYPPSQLEIIAPVNIKNALPVKDGDTVRAEISL